jgi:hypothetical protein
VKKIHGMTLDALASAPFVLDPNDSRVLLAGGKSLWRCADARADALAKGE